MMTTAYEPGQVVYYLHQTGIRKGVIREVKIENDKTIYYLIDPTHHVKAVLIREEYVRSNLDPLVEMVKVWVYEMNKSIQP